MIELSKTQIKEIDTLLKEHCPAVPLLNHTQWEGFLTAWVSVPKEKTISDLINTILGPDAVSRMDVHVFNTFRNNCQIHMDLLTEVFESDEYDFMPIFVEEREDRFEDIQIFCQGYVQAINLFKEEMFSLTPKFKVMIQEIVTISQGESAVDDIGEEGGIVPDNIGLVSYNVETLYNAWRGNVRETDFGDDARVEKELMSDEEYGSSHYAVIDRILKKYAGEFSLFNSAAVDGFMAGLISGPELIKPSEWLPEIWGGGEYSPAWESEKEFQEFFSCVAFINNDNAQILGEDPENYTPMMSVSEKGEHSIASLLPWCSGYVKAIQLRQEDWKSMPEEFMKYLNAIMLVGTGKIFDENGITNISKESEADLLNVIIEGVPLLYEYWHAYDGDFEEDLQEDSTRPFVRQEKKVGRNDLCPCGSGRKYKKCCGN